MKYDIEENGKDLYININGVSGKKEKLLDAFQQCQEGTCSCPTDEYKNLESLEVEENDNSIKLHLKSKNGEKFNKEEINRCLDHTSKSIEETQDLFDIQ